LESNSPVSVKVFPKIFMVSSCLASALALGSLCNHNKQKLLTRFFWPYYLGTCFSALALAARSKQDLGQFVEHLAGRSILQPYLYRVAFYLKKGDTLSVALGRIGTGEPVKPIATSRICRELASLQIFS
jgi:hypothetical protein